MIGLIYFVILLGSVYVIGSRAIRHMRHNAYVLLFGELFIPATLLVAYGFGGAALLFEGVNRRQSFHGVNFENFDILYIFVVIIAVAFTYTVSFNLTFGGRRTAALAQKTANNSLTRAMTLSLMVLLLVDAYVRLERIANGTYFNWMVAHSQAADIAHTSTLYLVQKSWASLIATLIYWRSRQDYKWRLVFAFYLLAFFLEGDRSTLLVALVGVFLVKSQFDQRLRKDINWGGWIVLVVIFFGFVGPLIQEVRYEFRKDMGHILKRPEELPARVVSEYIPAVSSIERLYGSESAVSESGAGLLGRLESWPAYMATLNNRLSAEWPYIPAADFARALALPVPEALYPGSKPMVNSAAVAQSHFALGYREVDPATTVFTDIFGYTGLMGCIVLACVIGAGNGLIGSVIIRAWKDRGVVVYFGFAGLYVVAQNSFAGGLVNLRNQVVLLVLFRSVMTVSEAIMGRGRAEKASRSAGKSAAERMTSERQAN
jgi:hypothetical protein